MLNLLAEIRFRTAEEGGMTRNPHSGLKPSFMVNGDLIMCELLKVEGDNEFKRGKTYKTKITLGYGEMYKQHIHLGMNFTLQTGEKVIANGIVIEILD